MIAEFKGECSDSLGARCFSSLVTPAHQPLSGRDGNGGE